MLYVFARLAARHPKTHRLILALRWAAHVIAGHPWTLPTLAVGWVVNPYAAVGIFSACEMVYGQQTVSRVTVWRHTWAFRRQWPTLWAATQTRSLNPHGSKDGLAVRPVGIAPRLPLLSVGSGLHLSPQVSPVAAALAVKPAPGQTLEDVAAAASTIAAQLSHVDRIDIEYATSTQTEGRMLITFTNSLTDSQQPLWA